MQADSKKVIRLLKTVRGQMDGIIKMVEENRYCVDIVNQLLAAEAVLRRAHCEVLRAHLAHCVADSIGPAGQEKTAEMMDIIDKISK